MGRGARCAHLLQPLSLVRANQLFLIANEAERALTPEVRAECHRLEREVEALRLRKGQLSSEAYDAELQRRGPGWPGKGAVPRGGAQGVTPAASGTSQAASQGPRPSSPAPRVDSAEVPRNPGDHHRTRLVWFPGFRGCQKKIEPPFHLQEEDATSRVIASPGRSYWRDP